MERTGIEISFPIELAADLNIWVNREDWNAMSGEERQAFLSDKVELAYIRFADDCIRIDPTATVSAMLTNPEMGGIDLSRISVYDPEVA